MSTNTETLSHFRLNIALDLIRKCRSVDLNKIATRDVCGPAAQALVHVYGVRLVEIWSVDPRRGNLILIAQAAAPGIDVPGTRLDVLSLSQSLTGEAVEARRPVWYLDVRKTSDSTRNFQDQNLIDQLALTSMWCVPVFNTSNPHQVLCVVNIFPTNPMLPGDRSRAFLTSLSSVLALAIEANLRERAYRMANMLGQRLAPNEETGIEPFPKPGEVYGTLARTCQEAVAATVVTVFVFDELQDRLLIQAEVYGRTPPERTEGLEAVRPTAEVIQHVYDTNREFLVPMIGKENEPNFFLDDSSIESDSCVVIPLQDVAGRCRGVIRILRSAGVDGQHLNRFSYDDIAVLEAIVQGFAPTLEELKKSRQYQFSLQKLTHELRNPVNTVSMVLTKLEREAKELDYRFQFDHFREGKIYTDMMRRLMTELFIARYGPSNVPLRRESTNLESDVVVPAKRFIVPLLRERRIAAWQFTHFGFKDLGRIDVDPALITQVIFNLLDNAAKYFDRRPDEFRCEIVGHRTERYLEIEVRDNGPGIDSNLTDRLFSYGVRGDNRHLNAFGEGLGLWISRGIAVRHGGQLDVTKHKGGATFTLRLPRTYSR